LLERHRHALSGVLRRARERHAVTPRRDVKPGARRVPERAEPRVDRDRYVATRAGLELGLGERAEALRAFPPSGDGRDVHLRDVAARAFSAIFDAKMRAQLAVFDARGEAAPRERRVAEAEPERK